MSADDVRLAEALAKVETLSMVIAVRYARMERLMDMNDELREKLAAIGALADQWHEDHHPGRPDADYRACAGCRLRTVLDDHTKDNA